MANLNLIQSAQIVKGGGEITSNRYKDAGEDDTHNLKAGQLCKIVGGTVEPVTNTGTAAEWTTAGAPWNAAAEYVVSLEDKIADGTFVTVQKVTPTTVFEGYVVDQEVANDVTMDSTDIGKVYEGRVDANGRFGVQNDATAGIFVIEDVDVNYDPYKNGDDFEKDSIGVRHSRVRFRIISAKLI